MTRSSATGWISGPYVVGGLARIADDDLGDARPQALEERLEHRLLDQQARPGEAHLPGVVVLVGGGRGGGVEVGVGEDEERRLAAELERDRRQRAAASW